MQYRKEIDGLRTVAVLPVILFHAGLWYIPGGFTGVDVFFVISGYLITSIIVEPISKNNFSILDFYRRRVIRIFPLLITVICAVLIFGNLFLMPSEFANLVSDIPSAALFYSNIYYYFSIDYFAGPAESELLLHTWSLAVEEQFYIFFPLLLVAISRWGGRRYAICIGVLSVLSFYGSLIVLRKWPAAAFYMLPPRAWELGAGALLAVYRPPYSAHRHVKEWLSIAGLALILGGYVAVTAESRFPGWGALFPVIGAFLIIGYSEGTRLGSILSQRAVVYIGLISYGLYLWHWPVIVFYRTITGGASSAFDVAFVLVTSFALASASYLTIERPFRQNSRNWNSAKVVPIGFAAVLLIGLGGLILSYTGQIGRSFTPDMVRLDAYSNYTKADAERYHYQFRDNDCFLASSSTGGLNDMCLQLSSNKTNVLVFGDSHAAHLWRAVSRRFPDANVMQATVSGCIPVLKTQGATRCKTVVNYVLNQFLTKNDIDYVLFAARWQEDAIQDVIATSTYMKRYVKDVYIMGPTIEYHGVVPTILARENVFGPSNLLSKYMDVDKFALNESMKRETEKAKLNYISVTDIVCPNRQCVTIQNGAPVQFDYGHFTPQGAEFVADHLPDQLFSAKTAASATSIPQHL